MRTLIVVLAFAGSLAAEIPGEPWPLIRLVRTGAENPVNGYASARVPLNVVALEAVTGLPERWQVECHDSFASIEAVDRALAGGGRSAQSLVGEDDVLPSSRTVIGVLRPGWSYRPDEAIRLLTKARYVFVSVYRVRPGSEVDFGEMARLRKLEFDSINSERPEMVYQVISGAPSGVYVFIAPLSSLSILDNEKARRPVYADGVAKGARAAAANADVVREHLIFRVDPSHSWVSDDFAAGDVGFWREGR